MTAQLKDFEDRKTHGLHSTWKICEVCKTEFLARTAKLCYECKAKSYQTTRRDK